MKVIADLHLHSRFSRAVSKDMTLPVMADWAAKKGIKLVGTADWTHPIWFRELLSGLKEEKEGVFKVKGGQDDIFFVLSTELSSIYSQGGKTRRIHYLVIAPGFKTIEKINQKLRERGINLLSDGRPILGLSAKDVAQIVFEVDKKCLIIPAHVWTPWFSLYGSKSGFDSIEECFGELAENIYAIETGLSSDPAMNWRITENTSRKIVSFGDAHSPKKLGREATIFELKEISFKAIREAVVHDSPDSKIGYTIEFYPEEGKYHYTGHRKCGVSYSPNEAKKKGMVCPTCGKPLTVGVMSRVEALATQDVEVESETDEFGVRWIKDQEGKKTPYIMLVPLAEILAEVMQVGVNTKGVDELYERLVSNFGSEFKVLLETPLEDIEKIQGQKLSEAIKKVRAGDIFIEPGFDGVFGKVKVWKGEEEKKQEVNQSTLF
jgi:uncharacterized protein (TIGR00375 family)